MKYHDRSRAADMAQALVFRETLRADVDRKILELLRLGVSQAETARIMCVNTTRVRRLHLQAAHATLPM